MLVSLTKCMHVSGISGTSEYRTLEDLRLPRDDEVLPVYVLTRSTVKLRVRQKAFLLAGVRALKQAYRDHGGELLVKKGTAVDVLSNVVVSRADREFCVGMSARAADRQRRVDEAAPDEILTDLVLVDPAGLDSQYENHSRCSTTGRPTTSCRRSASGLGLTRRRVGPDDSADH